jgi:hypothetical protein
MVQGYILRIKSSQNIDGVRFSHTLYGRIIPMLHRKKYKYYYSRGMLHNTLFSHLGKGKIFVEDIASIDFNKLQQYGKIFIVEEGTIDETKYPLKTGKDYWLDKYKAKGVKVHVTKKNS